MLDCYAGEETLDVRLPRLHPEQRVGGIELYDFVALDGLWRRLRADGVRADYMRDFAPTPVRIVTAAVALDHFARTDAQHAAARSKMRTILLAAADRNCGLFAVSD